MPNASDKRSVTFAFAQLIAFSLGFEGAKLMACMVFDYIILNGRPFGRAST